MKLTMMVMVMIYQSPWGLIIAGFGFEVVLMVEGTDHFVCVRVIIARLGGKTTYQSIQNVAQIPMALYNIVFGYYFVVSGSRREKEVCA